MHHTHDVREAEFNVVFLSVLCVVWSVVGGVFF